MHQIARQSGSVKDVSYDFVAAKQQLVRKIVELQPILKELGQRFAEEGHQLALVGGPVRDALLGRDAIDIDLTTDATPEQIEDVVKGWADATWDVGRAFGTIALRKNKVDYEITTYRSESYQTTSRKPEVVYGDSLVEDLRRRDFTVNAMAVTIPDLEFVDPFGGLQDLAKERLHTPSLPQDSFSDDPLRMMRAARFVSQLGFIPSEEVVQAIEEMTERLSIVSAERIRDELVKLINGKHPRAGVDMLVRTGLSSQVLPELDALLDTADEHGRHKDVYQHTLTVLDQAIDGETGAAGEVPGPDFILRFAALMHDIGKPATRRFESDGRVTFYHHDVVGAKMTAKRMRALRFDKDTIKAVSRLVELHLRFYGYRDSNWTDSAVRRYVTDAGPYLERLHCLIKADVTTQNRRKATRLRDAYAELQRRIQELATQEELKAIRPDLNGEEIMSLLGVKPSPLVGKASKFMLGIRMEEGPLSKEQAIARLKDWWAQQPESQQGQSDS